jgi:hypothetical protein
VSPGSDQRDQVVGESHPRTFHEVRQLLVQDHGIEVVVRKSRDTELEHHNGLVFGAAIKRLDPDLYRRSNIVPDVLPVILKGVHDVIVRHCLEDWGCDWSR